MKGDGRMRRLLTAVCLIGAVLMTITVCSAGLRINGLPETIGIETGKTVQFKFTLDNSDGTDLQNVSLLLEEVIPDGDTEELAGTLIITGVNGEKPEDETDFVVIDQIPAGSVCPVEATYLLYVDPQALVCVTATLYDEDFEVITSEKIRCTMPGTANEDKLMICGIPVLTIIIVLIALNIFVWGAAALRKLRKLRHPEEQKQQGSAI